jgi:hypothetical protein
LPGNVSATPMSTAGNTHSHKPDIPLLLNHRTQHTSSSSRMVSSNALYSRPESHVTSRPTAPRGMAFSEVLRPYGDSNRKESGRGVCMRVGRARRDVYQAAAVGRRQAAAVVVLCWEGRQLTVAEAT